MQNIFDVFNNRKLGLNSLCEGYEVYADEVEAFDDLDTAMEALETIATESRNEMIELQSALYLEDLVLENMMYENFNEYEMESVIEATVKERATGIAGKIQAQWKKFQEWFIATAKAISNFFTNGENLVIKNKARIPEAMSNCNVKVKMHRYNDPRKAMEKTNVFIDKLRVLGQTSTSNNDVLDAMGLKDKKGVGGVVKEYFMSTKEPEEQTISSINAQIAMSYAGNKKEFINGINKNKKIVDQSFKEVLSIIKSESKKEDGRFGSEQVKIFNFAKSLTSTAINAEIACIKKGASENASIIRKALSSNSGAGLYPLKDKLAARKAAKATQESFDGLQFLDDMDFDF